MRQIDQAIIMPSVDGGLTFCAEDDLVLVRLQSASPPKARRPHFQEGYLVGDFPLRRDAVVGNNLTYRMLAKFRIQTNGFWSDVHRGIPWGALMPEAPGILEQIVDPGGPAAGYTDGE